MGTHEEISFAEEERKEELRNAKPASRRGVRTN
jgi:hypothetical protein